MSSIAHRYADFGPIANGASEEVDGQTEQNQDENLQAFEEGYQAGWTDAEKNVAAEQAAVGAEFVQTLQDLAFTYHEALARLNRGLKPMFEQLTSTLLPKVLPPALKAHVVAELMDIAKSQSEGEITLRVADGDIAMIEDLISQADLHLSVSLKSDDSLTPGQLMLELDLQSREINLDKVNQGIVDALNAFNFHSQAETSHD